MRIIHTSGVTEFTRASHIETESSVRLHMSSNSTLHHPPLTRWRHSPVVLLLHQMVARAEGHQMRVVGGRRDGHGARAAHVRVAQLVRQHLQLVRVEVVVVPQHVVVRRARRALKHVVRKCVVRSVRVSVSVVAVTRVASRPQIHTVASVGKARLRHTTRNISLTHTHTHTHTHTWMPAWLHR